MSQEFPSLGFGLGLRPKHYPYIFEHKPNVDWFEIISENFMDTDGRPKRNLARIREDYPIVMHGVSLSIGTVDPLNSEYLKKLKNLMDWAEPAWISDHLCWTGVAHKNVHDLLPVPYTEEALAHIVDRISQVQDYLGRPIALENPSTYLEFNSSTIPESEFISRMVKESGCQILLDVNNIYVSCFNHRLDPKAYIDAMPLDHVIQIHLAGHENKGTHIIDTHDGHVVDEVWALYKYVIHKAGRVPNTMIEWDDNIPEFPVLFDELEKARKAATTAQNFGVLPNLAQDRPHYRTNNSVTLLDEQNRMQKAIIAGPNTVDHPSLWVRDKENFPSDKQLDVYVNAYRYRLFDVVAEDYPALLYHLGQDQFNKLIWSFIEENTSNHFNIGRYALKLPTFLQNFYPDDIIAHELCELETKLTQLFDATESKALQIEDISTITPDILMESSIQFRDALAFHSFQFSTNFYYQDIMDGNKPSAPALKPSWVAVFRNNDVMWRMDLEYDEFRLLQLLFSGIRIGTALEEVGISAEENLSDWFGRWMQHGILSEIKINHKTKLFA